MRIGIACCEKAREVYTDTDADTDTDTTAEGGLGPDITRPGEPHTPTHSSIVEYPECPDC